VRRHSPSSPGWAGDSPTVLGTTSIFLARIASPILVGLLKSQRAWRHRGAPAPSCSLDANGAASVRRRDGCLARAGNADRSASELCGDGERLRRNVEAPVVFACAPQPIARARGEARASHPGPPSARPPLPRPKDLSPERRHRLVLAPGIFARVVFRQEGRLIGAERSLITR